jgi:hypothetical protein
MKIFFTYVSPKGGAVPAYLVVPNGKGNFAAVIWGHWMMPNSPTANRNEFLEEAVALAPAGVVSLLMDAPYVRPDFKPNPDPLSSQKVQSQKGRQSRQPNPRMTHHPTSVIGWVR